MSDHKPDGPTKGEMEAALVFLVGIVFICGMITGIVILIGVILTLR